MRPSPVFLWLTLVSSAALALDGGAASPKVAVDAGVHPTVDAGVHPAADAGAPAHFAGRDGDLPELTKALGGGKRRARVLVDKDTLHGKAASLVSVTLEGPVPKAFHTHPGAELVVVLEGTLALDAPTGTRLLEAGDAAYLPPRSLHSLSRPLPAAAPNAAPLTRYLALYAPPGPELSLKGKKDPSTTAVNKPRFTKAELAAAPPVVVSRAQVKPVIIAQGNGSATLLLERDSLGGANFAYAGWLELGEKANVPKHVHSDEEELLYIVSGSAEMVIAGQKETLGAGSVVHVPASTAHSAVVTSKEALVAVQFYAPGGPEQRFKPPPAPQP